MREREPRKPYNLIRFGLISSESQSPLSETHSTSNFHHSVFYQVFWHQKSNISSIDHNHSVTITFTANRGLLLNKICLITNCYLSHATIFVQMIYLFYICLISTKCKTINMKFLCIENFLQWSFQVWR